MHVSCIWSSCSGGTEPAANSVVSNELVNAVQLVVDPRAALTVAINWFGSKGGGGGGGGALGGVVGLGLGGDGGGGAAGWPGGGWLGVEGGGRLGGGGGLGWEGGESGGGATGTDGDGRMREGLTDEGGDGGRVWPADGVLIGGGEGGGVVGRRSSSLGGE